MSVIDRIRREIKTLEDRLLWCERTDRWELWTWEMDERLKELKAELLALSI